MAKTYGIVLAAGSGQRMGHDRNKMFIRIGNMSVLERSLTAFERSGCFDHIVIVYRGSDKQETDDIAKRILSLPFILVEGGSERQYSVENALRSIQDADIVAVHDGARCFIKPEAIRSCVEKARETGAAAAGVKTRDTIKVVDGDTIKETLDRSRLVNIQTPQVFRYELLNKAHESAAADGFLGTDECGLVERMGVPVSVVDAGYDNIKITTQEDILLGRMIAGETVRTGTGYDAHKLVEGRPLVLGGVTIPHTHGLLGHSDADVLLHAIMDALLGAAALGDIGKHFPCTDEFKDASSLDLLARTREIIEEKGFAISHIDATLIMQKPKVAPYIDKMRSRISQILGIGIESVSVKATTTEGMGFEGTGEGASAMAVATIVG
jgi:2-C-methyl-D-erythritol 4-phosphate cytidylyltransferase/2-C-methyl-D-erythritol 2,4-cyclodiphosphate synthase